MEKKKPLTMKQLDERISKLEIQINQILRSLGETVNPILLQHETYIFQEKNKSWLKRFLGL